MNQSARSVLQKKVSSQESGDAVEFLARHTGLSKGVLKEAMAKGAVWLKRGRGAEKRLRRARSELKAGDLVFCYYDPEVLALTCPEPSLVADETRFSIWYKPAGLLSEGTRFGDHCAVKRFVEKHARPTRAVHLVHQLDRDTAGLMLFAHDSAAAAAFTSLFRSRAVAMRCRAEVTGDLGTALGETGALTSTVDGKQVETRFAVVGFDLDQGATTVDVESQVGRTPEIRHQLSDAGFPVIGDLDHGRANKGADGLRLLAWHLAFVDPLSGERREFSVAPEELSFR